MRSPRPHRKRAAEPGLNPRFPVRCFSCLAGDSGLTSPSRAAGVKSCPAPSQGSCGGSRACGQLPAERGLCAVRAGFGEQRCPFGWELGPRWRLGLCRWAVTLAWHTGLCEKWPHPAAQGTLCLHPQISDNTVFQRSSLLL